MHSESDLVVVYVMLRKENSRGEGGELLLQVRAVFTV